MLDTVNRTGELTAVTKAKDLLNHTLLQDLIEANEIYPRSPEEAAKRAGLQQEALTKCKVLLNLLDIALERGYIDIRRCEDWTKKILDVKNLTASWKKKDATRFSPKG